MVAVIILYGVVDLLSRHTWPPIVLLPYLVQLAIGFVGLRLIEGPLRDHAERVALLTDLTFTISIVAQLPFPSSTIAGTAMALSLKLVATALLLPWSAGTQYVSAVVTVVLYWAFLAGSGRVSGDLNWVPNCFAPLIAALLSGIGAARADRTRRALFRHERELADSAQISAALAHVAHELITGVSTPAVLDRLCQLTVEVLRCRYSYTLLRQQDGDVYVPVSGAGYTPEQWEGLRVTPVPGASLARVLAPMRQEEIVTLPISATADDPLEKLASQLGIGTVLGMPLRRKQDIVGLLAACFVEQRDAVTPLQEQIARGIAQLASLALENARLLEEIERASYLKSEFVATMSHELRTPLNIMIGYSDLLLEDAFGSLSGEQTDVVRRMDKSAQELLELINATLDLSRLEVGRVSLDVRETHMREVIAEIEAETRPLQDKPGINFVWHVPADLPPLRTDPLKLKVVLKNLVINAVKFTDRGSIMLDVYPRDGGIEICVADTGVGIRPEALPVIFEAFRQAHDQKSHPHSGVGLGLYIASRLLDMLGGTISVESEVGRGSIFRVWIPSDVQAIAGVPVGNPNAPTPTGEPNRVYSN